MKMIYCNCNISVLEELSEIFKNLGIDNYQIIEEIKGKDVVGDARLNTPVWPGFNSQITTQINEKKIEELIDAVRKYNDSAINKNEIITLVSWKIEDYICS